MAKVIDGELLPQWVYKLRPLAGIAGGLATIGSNPEKWAKTVVAEWAVGGILDAATYVLGWISYAYEKQRNIILDAIPVLTTPARIVERNVVGAIETVYGIMRMVANIAGLAGPPAAAFALALTTAFLAVVAYALVYVVLNWLPGGGLLEGLEENLET